MAVRKTRTAKKSTNSSRGSTRRSTKGAKNSSRSGKSTASSPFLKQLAAKKGAWKKAKKAKPNQGIGQQSDIKDGTYKCILTSKYGVKEDKTWATINWCVVSGKYKGEKGSRYFNLNEDEHWEWLSGMLQQALDEDFADLGDNPGELKDLLDRLNEDKPVAMCDIKRNGEYLNFYIRELVDDEEDEDSDEDESEEDDEEEDEEDSDVDDSEEEEEDDDSDEDESDDEEEDEEYEEDDEEEIEPLAKGDIVMYKPKGKRKALECEVTTSNKAKQTATLQEVDGDGKWVGVSWDDPGIDLD